MLVDIGFWDINGNYIEDYQEVDEIEVKEKKMIKKLINKIIMGTKQYCLLKECLRHTEEEYEALKQNYCTKVQILKDKDIYINCLETELSYDKKFARKIVRAINKDDKVLAKQLCNKIIKGE